MKYMGSKRVMLQNGLGELLHVEAKSACRVVDLFCGGGSVSWFAATKLDKPVLAIDLQKYATVIAGAVVERVRPANVQELEETWLAAASKRRGRFDGWRKASKLDQQGYNTATWRKRSQELCADNAAGGGLVWRAYGAHYFSPTQALTFDGMLHSLPLKRSARQICLAATIVSASQCAASPGHTAQPFKATRTAARYLREAWQRDPIHYAEQALRRLCPLHATRVGKAVVSDANTAARKLRRDDLVFVDPPYSGVHYSRFYHVLETIARGRCGNVDGVGRYPPSEERPSSRYSKKTEARPAMVELFQTISEIGCRAIVTFPNDNCSNGLSGKAIEQMASEHFDVSRRSVKTRFSTLGGNCLHRDARKVADELILVLKPSLA